MSDASETARGTFDLYDSLKPLPVPTLEETCRRYLASVKPLVEPADYARIESEVAELQAPGGAGQRAQAALEARAAGMDNWLLDWWARAAYLDWPDSLVCNSSIGISADARVAPGDQAMRAAQVAAVTLDFHLAIANRTLPPETQRDGSGLDMSLLTYLFATNRPPGAEGDRIVSYGPDEARHILVMRRGRLYRLDVIGPDGTRPSAGALMAAFRRIMSEADAAGPAAPVAALTAARRPDWAAAREALAQDPTNRESLDQIDRAIFVLCLDADAHEGFDALARAGLHGQAGERWHDKSLHMIVDAQGRVTLHGEHTPLDAGGWVPLLDAVCAETAPPTPAHGESAPAPVALRWSLTPETRQAIDAATWSLEKITGDLDLRVFHFDDFGKQTIKTLKTGPDPLVQLAFQTAYWRLHRRSPKTYEAASTRMYRGGRTETIRSVSSASRAFVKAMDDPAIAPARKVELARAAFADHVTLVKEASAGFGVDRHMLGLQLMAREIGESLPALFDEPVHKLGWELSTAQLPMRLGFVNHFAPVCPQGYGVGYVVKDDHVNMTVTAWRSHPDTDATRFGEAICQAMRDLRGLIEQVDQAAA